MKRQFQGILYYLAADIRYAFSIFWIILSSFLILSIIIQLVFGQENMVVQFNFSAPVYIFAAIVGFLTVRNVLTYLIKMGATRKFLYVGVVIYFFVLVLLNALIANGIDFFIKRVLKLNIQSGIQLIEGEKVYNYHHLADILDKNNYLYQIIIDTAISFFFICVLFIIGLVFYRFGLLGGFSLIGLIIFTFIAGLANKWLIDFFIWIFKDFSIVFFYQLTFWSIIIYLLSYLLLRRMTI